MATQKEIQKTWEAKINKAKAERKDWSDQFRVNLARDYFEGKQNPGYPKDEWITINKIYSHLQAQLPTLYNVDPYFYIKLKRSFNPDPEEIAEMEQKADIRQAMLNYLKGELKLKEKARLAIQDAHFSYGVLKVRYAADEKKHPQGGEPIFSDEEAEGEQLALTDQEGNPLFNPDTIPVNERYEISRLHPDDFVWDAHAGPLEEKWGFVAERIRMTKEEAKQDKRFNRRVLNALSTKTKEETEKEKKGAFSSLKSSFLGDAQLPSVHSDKARDDVITFWEVYDLKKKQWMVIAEGGDAPLIKPQSLPNGVETHPYGILRFTLRDNSPYPIPPVSQAIDPQKEFCLARSRVLTHRKRFNRKYTVIKQMLDDESEISKLEMGEDGTVVGVKQHGAIEPIKDASLDQASYIEINALDNDMTEIFGSPQGARGVAGADSATEADILDTRLKVREGDRLSMVVDMIRDVAKKLDQLIQANITRDEAVKITGPQGEAWKTVRVEDFEEINGEFEYTVNVGATNPQLPDTERAQWIAFLTQVVVPLPHILTKPSVMKRMAEMFHIEDEVALEEFRQMGLQILQGEVPPPNATGGGPPGGSPASSTIGTALGSLGGNANGGGA